MKTVMMALMAVWVVAVDAQSITGTVVDSADNSPIPGALVTLHGGAIQVVAASDGSFSLGISGTDLLLVGAAKGYYYQSIHSDSPASDVQLALSKVPISNNSNYVSWLSTMLLFHAKDTLVWLTQRAKSRFGICGSHLRLLNL